MQIFTIGFTKKTAEQFFDRIKKAGVSRIVDARLNNVSQLAGFTKKEDLKYFAKSIANIDYVHIPLLAPTQEILDEYKKNRCDWRVYETLFLELMQYRKIEEKIAPDVIDGGCLLCSEDKSTNCHRRLVAEYLKSKWTDVNITHL